MKDIIKELTELKSNVKNGMVFSTIPTRLNYIKFLLEDVTNENAKEIKGEILELKSLLDRGLNRDQICGRLNYTKLIAE